MSGDEVPVGQFTASLQGKSGHVEIHADDRALAFEIVIVDCEHSSLILNYFDELIFQLLIPGQIYENILEICYSDNRKNDAEPGPESRKSTI